MPTLTSIVTLAGIKMGGVAAASVHSTQWTLRNESSIPMTLSCRNVSVSTMEIVLPERTVKAGGQLIHDWGDRFYNEGLWLNPGKWSCSLRAAGAERTETFTTDWGEAITLELSRSGSQLRLRKIPLKGAQASRPAP
jgi:hypothetical protein